MTLGSGCIEGTDIGKTEPPNAPQRTRVDLPITWPHERPNKEVLDRLTGVAKSEVSRSPVPVLVPNDASLLETGSVIVGDTWYVFVAVKDAPKLAVRITGRSVAFKYEGRPQNAANGSVRGRPAWRMAGAGREDVSWEENGATYTGSIECETDEDEATSCGAQEFLTAMVQSAVYVGGRGAQ